MNMERGLGACQSPADYRDLIARAAVLTPETATILPMMTYTDLGPVLDQNKIPACVAHDVVYLMKRYFFNQTGKWINLSPRFLDIMAKRSDGLNREIDGTYPRLILKIASQYGCATEDYLPNLTTLSTLDYRNDDLVSEMALEEAAKYKIPGFINIATDPISTRSAVYLYGAVSSLFKIGEEFWKPSWNAVDIDPIRTPKTVVSGHQLAVVGWDGGLNYGRNEWGEEWNTKGEFRYDPVAWQKFIVEQWAIASVPKDLKFFLAQLPSPANFHYQWNLNMKRGEHGRDIGMAQVALMILGYLKPVAPDEFGYYGAKTSMAVYQMQVANKVWPPSPDNIGPLTRGLLNKKFV